MEPPPAPIEIVAREDFALQVTPDGAVEQILQLGKHEMAADLAHLAIVTGLAFRCGSEQATELEALAKRGELRRPMTPKFLIRRQPDGTPWSEHFDPEKRRMTVTTTQEVAA